jgi:hypothetical protein
MEYSLDYSEHLYEHHSPIGGEQYPKCNMDVHTIHYHARTIYNTYNVALSACQMQCCVSCFRILTVHKLLVLLKK